MENFGEFMKINESSSNEIALLTNLYSFYLKKYTSKKIAKVKFKEQVEFLKEQGEVSTKVVNKFFKENDIAVEKTSKPKLPSFLSSKDNIDFGCGSVSRNVGCGSTPSKPVKRSSSYSGCGSSSNTGC